MDETAKAAQEIAKTTSKAIDAASGVGNFLAELIREPLKERLGIVTDNIKYRRWENLVDLQTRAKRKIEMSGLASELRQIPLNVGVPLIEAASLADDPSLRDRWANLQLNFSNPASGTIPQKAFVSILEELTPLEATILDKIYALPDVAYRGVMTGELPANAEYLPPVDGIANPVSPVDPVEPSEEVALAISNLIRLGCLTPATSWDGVSTHVVYRTALGRALVRACSNPV